MIDIRSEPHLVTFMSLSEEFLAKLEKAEITLPSDKNAAIVTHCGAGGRGGRAAGLLKQHGYINVRNGKSPDYIREARKDASGAEPKQCPFPFILLHDPVQGVKAHPVKVAAVVGLLAVAGAWLIRRR